MISNGDEYLRLFALFWDSGLMTNQHRAVLSFHRSASIPCPYLDGKFEQQLFTALSGPEAQADFEYLSRVGFRRSHHIIYRPICSGCAACIAVRVRVCDFIDKRSWRRIRQKNSDITVRTIGPKTTTEQFLLFQHYVQSRHHDSEMAFMNQGDYENLIKTSPVKTTIREYRHNNGGLAGVCLVDEMAHGPSAVYSFFNPDLSDRSFGSFIILDLIDWAKKMNWAYVYLGYWVENSAKMSYKRRFQPLEGFIRGAWTSL